VPEVSLLLWDVGGVLLSNAWDHDARRAAASEFGLDASELERRHEAVVEAFETGHLGLDDYLATVVFHAPRPFSAGAFRTFMFDRSTPRTSTLDLARSLHRRGGPLMGALNNESRELNEHRIASFHLREVLDVFLSSCYPGLRKPDPEAFRYALALTQRAPSEALFLDDRPENVEAAGRVGIRTLLVREPERLAEELTFYGITSN
jgi:putative hydrolase of the HAD superfamily